MKFKKILELALKKGYKSIKYSYAETIFNHDFLKAIFGECEHKNLSDQGIMLFTECKDCGNFFPYGTKIESTKFYLEHIVQLSLLPTLKERIKYLEDNVK